MTDFENLTTESVAQQAPHSLLVLPLGAIEQHGPHLPLTVDAEIPLRLAATLTETFRGVVAPAIFYGARSLPHSGGGPGFPGTIHVRGSVLTAYLEDVIAGYVSSQFNSIVIINGHYENESFLFEALELCRQAGLPQDTRIVAVSWWNLAPQSLLDQIFGDKFPGWHAEHAGTCETSLMLHLREELVGPARVHNPTPPRAGIYLFPTDPSKLSNRGVLGSTLPSSAEIGRMLYETIASQLVALVREHMGSALTAAGER